MRIAVLANLKKNAPTWEGMVADQWDDLDSPRTVDALVAALQSGGHEAVFMEASIHPPYNLIERLKTYAPDLCFNISESHFGDSRESQIPAVLEMLQIPYTGSQVLTLALALDKPMTKRVLLYHDLPTPEFQVFERADEPLDEDLITETGDLRYPMFVKPSREGTSMGVTAQSIVRTVPDLRAQVTEQLTRYRQPILVEHYIEGREITVGMVGNLEPTSARRINKRAASSDLPAGLTFLPPLEIDFSRHLDTEDLLYSNRIKTEWAEEMEMYICPAALTPAQVDELNRLAAATFCVVGCKDVTRVDFRLDKHNGDKPYILELNPLPGLNPDLSDLVLEVRALGWTYEQLINAIAEAAIERHGLHREVTA